MKLIINYDFFDAILNVNQSYTPMKIIRNEKKLLLLWYTPILTICNFVSSKNISVILQEYLLEFGFLFGSLMLNNYLTGVDEYKNKSIDNLKKLVFKLNDLYIRTNYDLLLESELISKKYKVNISKDSLLEVMESKYVLVPTYDFNGNIKDTSILQEHVIGSNDYVLSIGSLKKELKPVYSSI